MSVYLVKKFFREFDMFSSYATLRTKGEPQTSNTCAGVLSFVILLLFIYLFISQFTEVANWQKIQSVVTQNNTFDAQRNVGTFMVGVGLQGFRIDGVSEYLRFQMIEITKKGTSSTRRYLKTQKCTKQHWSQLNESIDENYVGFSLQKKICLALGEQFQIQQPSNQVYKYLKIQINACRRQYYSNKSMMYSDCASQNLTWYRNSQYIQQFKYFIATVVYINTAFNPLSKKPTTKFMESVRLTFTITQGNQASVQLLTYDIETDSSILPYEQLETQSGYANHKTQHNNFEVVKYFQHASCTFSLSSTSILITRNIGKLDEILSYSGGLFGIIISFLAFFMMSFNKYRYELMTAESAFNYNEDGKKIKQKDFTFLLYLKYQIYDWVKTLTCKQIPWKDCQQVDETREQAVNQLDIRLMFKKIQYFQRFIQHIISDKQKIGLFLTEPPSIEKVRIKRMVAQYYDKVIMGCPAVTIEDLNTATGLFQYACDELKVKDQQNSRSSLHDEVFYERQDILQFAIQKYDELRKQFQEEQDVKFDKEQQQIENYIAITFFTIPEASRKKIQRKIPIKILKRLMNIKKNQIISSVGSINLEI